MCKNNSKSLQEIVEKLTETNISAINAIKEKTLQEEKFASNLCKCSLWEILY